MKMRTVMTILLTVIIICTGLWFYLQWDIRRFEAALPKAPSPQTETRETAPAEPAQQGQKVTSATDTSVENSAHVEVELTEAVVDVYPDDIDVYPDDTNLDSDLDTLLEEAATDAIAAGDIGEAPEAVPYDYEVVKAGFDDYNAYLATEPEYAYQRLDAAFREQYGDDPDVNIIVETVRRNNEGTLTIDDAIYHTEAMIRLVSKISPPEAVQVIADHLEYLKESKQLLLESGDDIEHQFNLRFHVGE